MMKVPLLIVVLSALVAAGVGFFGGVQYASKLETGRSGAGQEGPNGPRLLGTTSGGESSGKKEGAGAAEADAGTERARGYREVIQGAELVLKGGGMMDMSGMVKVWGMLQDIPASDIPKALEYLENNSSPQGRMMLQMALLSRWGEEDGGAAMAYANNVKGMAKMAGVMSVAAAWSKKDPDGALNWYLENKDENGGGAGMGMMGGAQGSLMSIFQTMGARDLDNAFAKLNALESDEDRRMALNGLSSVGMMGGDHGAVLEKMNTLEDPELRKTGRTSVLSQWGMFEPESAARWLDSAELVEGESRNDMARQIASGWLNMNPREAADWLVEGSEEPAERSQNIAHAVGQWVHRDANAAGEWLSQFEPGPELDPAMQRFATGVAGNDGESAFAWASQIADDDTRNSTLSTVYHQVVQKQPDLAAEQLENSGMPEGMMQKVMEGAANSPPVPTPTPFGF
ncbi:MAG: hypothetical protein AAF514_14150 [Verrucomicrobiota bacterium]